VRRSAPVGPRAHVGAVHRSIARLLVELDEEVLVDLCVKVAAEVASVLRWHRDLLGAKETQPPKLEARAPALHPIAGGC
jgi:hypothetical protein